MRQNNKLQKTTNWAHVKSVFRSIMNIEGINSSKYDFSNICCYSCEGISLQGNNVIFDTKGGMSCWVDNNHYDIYELPLKLNNNSKGYGKFITLAFNKDFKYWALAKTSVRLSTWKNSTYETVKYIPYGAYLVPNETPVKSFRKTVTGEDFTYGGTQNRSRSFDSAGIRTHAYKTYEGDRVRSLKRRKHRN